MNNWTSQYEWKTNIWQVFQEKIMVKNQQYDLNFDKIQKQSEDQRKFDKIKATALSELIKNWELTRGTLSLSDGDISMIEKIIKKTNRTDDYKRMQLVFRWFSKEQMKEQYYESWNTREEVLSRYKKQYELYENSLILVRKLSNPKLSANEDTEIFILILNQIKKELSYNIDNSNRLKNFWKDASSFESNISNLENIIKKLNNILANI